MAKNISAAQGYMTVGEAARKMGVTVRTLQYYDREKLLSPSAVSEGGRRLYTDRDLVSLHQILSLKSLGFTLDDIKNRLTALETPAEVAKALAEQAEDIRRKIDTLSEALADLEKLKSEVLQMQTVDFKKYADIIVNLQMKNDFYFLIKCFDDQTLDRIRSRFDRESGRAFMDRFQRIIRETLRLQRKNILPQSEQGQRLAKEFWDMIMEFTNGDMNLLSQLIKIGNVKEAGNAWDEMQLLMKQFIVPALEIYFDRLGANPFGGETQ